MMAFNISAEISFRIRKLKRRFVVAKVWLCHNAFGIELLTIRSEGSLPKGLLFLNRQNMQAFIDPPKWENGLMFLCFHKWGKV